MTLTPAPFTRADLPRLSEIDRSEVIESQYRVERGRLVEVERRMVVPGYGTAADVQ